MAHSNVIHRKYKTDWETPQPLFDLYDRQFKFTLDAAASGLNAKCKRYFAESDNSLEQDWVGSVWLNPPYGFGINKWVEKAMNESIKHDSTIVCLLPSATDTAWFHEFVWGIAEVEFLRGRVQFLREGKKQKNGNPGANLVAIYKGKGRMN